MDGINSENQPNSAPAEKKGVGIKSLGNFLRKALGRSSATTEMPSQISEKEEAWQEKRLAQQALEVLPSNLGDPTVDDRRNLEAATLRLKAANDRIAASMQGVQITAERPWAEKQTQSEVQQPAPVTAEPSTVPVGNQEPQTAPVLKPVQA